VKESLDRLEQAARTTENLMPLLIETVRARASIGEICSTLENVFGLHEQI
jgi:methylmalonyl-CoA mutase N-terminal domain/subunit